MKNLERQFRISYRTLAGVLGGAAIAGGTLAYGLIKSRDAQSTTASAHVDTVPVQNIAQATRGAFAKGAGLGEVIDRETQEIDTVAPKIKAAYDQIPPEGTGPSFKSALRKLIFQRTQLILIAAATLDGSQKASQLITQLCQKLGWGKQDFAKKIDSLIDYWQTFPTGPDDKNSKVERADLDALMGFATSLRD